MSHTKHDLLRQLHGHIRAVEAKLERPIGILADLQGPKIRIGTFADKEVQIKAGDTFVFDTDKTPGDATRVYLPHPEIFASAKVGDNLLLNDGRLRVEITEAEPEKLTTQGDLRRRPVRPQGREPARHGDPHSGPHRKGPRRP